MTDRGGRGQGPRGGGGRGRGGFSDRGRGSPSPVRGAPPRGGRGSPAPAGRGGPPAPPVQPLNLPPANIDARLSSSAMDSLVSGLSKLKITHGEQPPTRPDFGKVGTPIKLRANYFPLTKLPEKLYEYDLKTTPAVGARRVKRRIYELLEKSVAFSPYARYSAHDGSAKLISATPIPMDADGYMTIVVKHYDEDASEDDPTSKAYEVTITFVKELDIADMQKYVRGDPDMVSYDINPGTAALNILLAKFATHNGGINVGKNRYFFPIRTQNEANYLGNSRLLVAYRGFFSSVRPVYNQLAVNLNVATTAFYAPGNLGNALMAFYGARGGNANHFIYGLRVKTIHLGYKKTVRRVGSKSATDAVFTHEKWGKISVSTYFKKQYNITLKYPSELPLLDIGTKDKANMVPAELCDILPDQPYRGKLLADQTRDMIDVACRSPAENQRVILQAGLAKMGFVPSPDSSLNAIGILLGQEMAVVPGRVLPPPQIKYLGNHPTQIRDSAWNMKDVKFVVAAPLRNCMALSIGVGGRSEFSGKDDPELGRLLNEFTDTCGKCGMNISNVRWTKHHINVPPNDPGKKNSKVAIERTLKSGSKPDIVLVILGSDDKALYAAIKYLCDVQLDVLTVCVVASKFRRAGGALQYQANVALKLNVKLGGTNHVLSGPGPLSWLNQRPTMLLGCDVTHPSPGSVKGTPSIAAVVGNIDANFVQYPASMRLQETKKEMITKLSEMVIERLIAYRQKTNKLPERVILFRDGVSEGQFQTVLREELPQIRDAFRRVTPQGQVYKPKLTIAVAGKRHHTRFYPVDEAGTDQRNNSNPKAGTVVDQGVTGVYTFDFFLQSHAGIKGQARPTHYTVLIDECGFKADELQTLTHALSYTFARATRGVSLVPPAFYADLACERGRCYLHDLLNGLDNVSIGGSTNSEEAARQVYEKAEKIWGNGPGNFVRQRMFYI
ncbi:Piwi domain-containing protein [Cantharellus anzutake]|uniref:Piwi domain-containing protein n=1 Tax=Cantharellus anzutake TaxID=1750568 RepID=UPI001903285B|nr:Piwi domain-containing protein [Cantharellus anzutake]KAF8341583.1 Piwi domain-containing protein [Cantharellus anzutake]